MTAGQGTIGSAGQPIYVQFPLIGTSAAGDLQVAGQQGVYLSVQATTDNEASGVALNVGNITSADGNVEVLVPDATSLVVPACGCEGLAQLVPIASTVNLYNITAGGNIQITVGSANSTVETDLAVEGQISAAGTVSVSSTGSLTQIWTGAGPDGNWSDASNWASGVVPQAGSRLLFPASAAGSTSTNDLPAGTTFSAITVEASGCVIDGNAVTLDPPDGTGLWIDASDTLSLPITLAGDTAIDVSSGSLTMLDAIDTAGYTLTVTGDSSAAATFDGPITGSGGVDLSGGVTVAFAGNNTYSGGTILGPGTLLLGDGGTNGSILGDVDDDGTLAFDRADDYTFAGAISGSGQVTNVGSGTPLLTGANSYSGGTVISSSMAAGSDTALGTAYVTISAARA